MGSVLFKPCDTTPKGCAGGSTWMSQDQGWRPSIPMGTQTGSNLGKVTEIVQAWEQQMVVSHQCRRVVPTKSMQPIPLGTTTLGLRRLGALLESRGWDLGNAAPPRDLGIPERRRTPSLGHDLDLQRAWQTKGISLTTLFPPCPSATELCLHLTPTLPWPR